MCVECVGVVCVNECVGVVCGSGVWEWCVGVVCVNECVGVVCVWVRVWEWLV